MNEWTLGSLARKDLDELKEMVENVSPGKAAADFYTAELTRRASLAAISAAEATENTASWTKVSAIAIALTFIVTAGGIIASFYT